MEERDLETHALLLEEGVKVHVLWSGTLVQWVARVTMASASTAPKPYWLLNDRPAPFLLQLEASEKGVGSDVYAMRYWTSLHVRLGLKTQRNVYKIVYL